MTRMLPIVLCLFCMFYAALCVTGCALVPRAARPAAGELDWADRFSTGREAAVAPGNSGSFQRHSFIKRNGQGKDAMVLVAPVAIKAALSGLAGRCRLQLQATPVFNIGDGLVMDIFVGSANERRQVFSRYLDAGRSAADRNWIPLEIELDVPGSDSPYLEIRASGGPQGDLVADWLALAALRITPAPASR
jgi:hypothetical protein